MNFERIRLRCSLLKLNNQQTIYRRANSQIPVYMIERMGVRIRSEDVADIIRMRKKDGDETVKPVIIEFKE